jgi:hypothetical protein
MNNLCDCGDLDLDLVGATTKQIPALLLNLLVPPPSVLRFNLDNFNLRSRMIDKLSYSRERKDA